MLSELWWQCYMDETIDPIPHYFVLIVPFLFSALLFDVARLLLHHRCPSLMTMYLLNGSLLQPLWRGNSKERIQKSEKLNKHAWHSCFRDHFEIIIEKREEMQYFYNINNRHDWAANLETRLPVTPRNNAMVNKH